MASWRHGVTAEMVHKQNLSSFDEPALRCRERSAAWILAFSGYTVEPEFVRRTRSFGLEAPSPAAYAPCMRRDLGLLCDLRLLGVALRGLACMRFELPQNAYAAHTYLSE